MVCSCKETQKTKQNQSQSCWLGNRVRQNRIFQPANCLFNASPLPHQSHQSQLINYLLARKIFHLKVNILVASSQGSQIRELHSKHPLTKFPPFLTKSLAKVKVCRHFFCLNPHALQGTSVLENMRFLRAGTKRKAVVSFLALNNLSNFKRQRVKAPCSLVYFPCLFSLRSLKNFRSLMT